MCISLHNLRQIGNSQHAVNANELWGGVDRKEPSFSVTNKQTYKHSTLYKLVQLEFRSQMCFFFCAIVFSVLYVVCVTVGLCLYACALMFLYRPCCL